MRRKVSLTQYTRFNETVSLGNRLGSARTALSNLASRKAAAARSFLGIGLNPEDATVTAPLTVQTKGELYLTSYPCSENWRAHAKLKPRLDLLSPEKFPLRSSMPTIKCPATSGGPRPPRLCESMSESGLAELQEKRDEISAANAFAEKKREAIRRDMQLAAKESRVTLLSSISELKAKRRIAIIARTMNNGHVFVRRVPLQTGLFVPYFITTVEHRVSSVPSDFYPASGERLAVLIRLAEDSSSSGNRPDLTAGRQSEGIRRVNIKQFLKDVHTSAIESYFSVPNLQQSAPRSTVVSPSIIAVLPKAFRYGDKTPRGIGMEEYTESLSYYKLDKARIEALVTQFNGTDEVPLGSLRKALETVGVPVSSGAEKRRCQELVEEEQVATEELAKDPSESSSCGVSFGEIDGAGMSLVVITDSRGLPETKPGTAQDPASVTSPVKSATAAGNEREGHHGSSSLARPKRKKPASTNPAEKQRPSSFQPLHLPHPKGPPVPALPLVSSTTTPKSRVDPPAAAAASEGTPKTAANNKTLSAGGIGQATPEKVANPPPSSPEEVLVPVTPEIHVPPPYTPSPIPEESSSAVQQSSARTDPQLESPSLGVTLSPSAETARPQKFSTFRPQGESQPAASERAEEGDMSAPRIEVDVVDKRNVDAAGESEAKLVVDEAEAKGAESKPKAKAKGKKGNKKKMKKSPAKAKEKKASPIPSPSRPTKKDAVRPKKIATVKPQQTTAKNREEMAPVAEQPEEAPQTPEVSPKKERPVAMTKKRMAPSPRRKKAHNSPKISHLSAFSSKAEDEHSPTEQPVPSAFSNLEGASPASAVHGTSDQNVILLGEPAEFQVPSPPQEGEERPGDEGEQHNKKGLLMKMRPLQKVMSYHRLVQRNSFRHKGKPGVGGAVSPMTPAPAEVHAFPDGDSPGQGMSLANSPTHFSSRFAAKKPEEPQVEFRCDYGDDAELQRIAQEEDAARRKDEERAQARKKSLPQKQPSPRLAIAALKRNLIAMQGSMSVFTTG